jgi:transposase-like protein
MRINCPHCGSDNVRYAHTRTPGERLFSLLGVRPLRCRACRKRFVVRIWFPRDLPYARCPKCWNMKLSTWSPSQYHVPASRGLLMFLGGSPYRCERCRHNFVSFRLRKYRWEPARSRSREPEIEQVASRAEHDVGA